MASENKSKVSILTNGIIKENPVLRLVEVKKNQLYQIPDLMDKLAANSALEEMVAPLYASKP